MQEMIDFFQKEAQECRKFAAGATKKKDRDFWLGLAERWDGLLQHGDGANVEAARPLRSGRSVLEKRFAKRPAA
jgi:hypothetical protein